MIRKLFQKQALFTQSFNKAVPVFRHGSHNDHHDHHDHHHGPVRVDSNDGTQNFLESITATIRGITNPNHIEEFEPNLSATEKAQRKRFLIFRYNPEDPSNKPTYVSYYVDITKIMPMYLDALLHIKNNMDPTLSFRRSCREGICGSCAMNCDGLHTLACIRAYDRNLDSPCVISPLGHMFVLRDLVVDMTNFYMQYRSISPYLKRKEIKTDEKKEYFQSIDDRAKLDGLYECVLCACCSTACPSYWWHPDQYLGPAILQQAYRWIVDSRDQYTEERLDQIAEDVRLDDCQQIGMCSVTCPKGLNPQLSLSNLMDKVKEIKNKRVKEETL